jgi:hypothetical protein
VTLGSFSYEAEHPPAGEFPGLTNLLKLPSLRSIEFSGVHFTSGLSRYVQAAFEGGSVVNTLRFTNCECRGDEEVLEEDAVQLDTLRALVQALQRDSSVKALSLVRNNFDGFFCARITSALLVNTTLVDLSVRTKGKVENVRWLQPLFVAVRINTALKSLNVDDLHFSDELVFGSLRDMLAQNSVLEALTLHSPENLSRTGVVSWRKILPFIRDNTTLKSLTISFEEDEFDRHVDTLCFDTVAMLGGNTTLECLDIKSSRIYPDGYFAALEGLRPNSALKTLRLSPVLALMGEEEMNKVVSLVKKNYSLEVLDERVSAHDKTGELGTLLRLNQAGRRYLIEDKVSIANCVEVLIDVRDDLGCLFYHLLENPILCNIEHPYNTKPGTDHFNKRQRF